MTIFGKIKKFGKAAEDLAIAVIDAVEEAKTSIEQAESFIGMKEDTNGSDDCPRCSAYEHALVEAYDSAEAALHLIRSDTAGDVGNGIRLAAVAMSSYESSQKLRM